MATKTKTKTKRKPKSIDFDDEDEVLREMAKELGVDPSDLTIRSSHMESFGTGTYWQVSAGRQEWHVAENEESATDLAVAIVTQDLEHEPEIFNQSFIESHIDKDRLRRDLSSDVEESKRDYLRHLDNDDFWKEAGKWGGVEVPERDEETGDFRDPTDKEFEAVVESMTETELREPLAYLEDIYGREDAVKKAIEIAGIDVEAAAKEAVSTDGPGHFLSGYDGHMRDTPRGLVYWRTN